VIPEAKHPKSLCFKISSSLFVVETLVVLPMLTTINFDHQLRLMAIEINDVWTNRVLASELEASHLSATQACPKSLLSISGILT